jgi:transposase-like protein
MVKEKSKTSELTKYIMENYEINSAQDLQEALKEMFKGTLQDMMNAEFDNQIGYEKNDNIVPKDNYRNGYSTKKVKSQYGEVPLDIPRDRNSEFDPLIVPKNSRNISGIEDKIIGLYGRGLSTREISDEIEEIYGIEVSHTMVSNITDAILPRIQEWQYRPLNAVYPLVFIDAIHFNVKEENQVKKKAAYIVLGVDDCGNKDVLGIWIGENESAKFWLSVLNDLKNRGVKDILIICSDGLTGISEAITTAYPKAMQQRCVVHLIRNSTRFVSYKHLKEFCRDLKTIYQAINETKAKECLKNVKDKWSKIYPTALKVWEDNWEAICTLFNYSADLRKIMYTTNAIESLNRSYRKYTKTKGVFPNDEGLMKSLYLATINIQKKWTARYRNWDIILGELMILFPGRI